MQKPSDPAGVRRDRNVGIVLILEGSVQDQFGAPLQVFLCFTLCSKQDSDIFPRVFESFLEDKVGELRCCRLSCRALVTTVFTAVLKYDGFQVRRKDALKSKLQRTESSP